MNDAKSYPFLCTINSGRGEDGVSRVSRLLWQVLDRATEHRCRHLNLLPEGKSLASASDKLKFARRMLTEHMRGRVGWIMYDHLGPARVQGLIPSRLKRPYAVFLHSIEVWSPLSEGRKRILRDARVRIANSNYTAQRVTAAHPEIGEIEVCHLALPPLDGADFGASNTKHRGNGASLNAPPATGGETDAALLSRINAQSLLIVGRMSGSERYKGHDQLIEIWPDVKGVVPGGQLIIVGGGDDVARLQRKAVEAGAGESIIFAGHVSDQTLQQLYRRAALFCMPSTSEGFGLVYLEAMRHRLPCIASPDNAAAEVVADNETGLLVEQAETAQLARAIIELLQNPARRKEMGEAGFERWQRLFSFENFEQRMLRILDEASLLKPTKISERCVA
jgi:phosphatidylinositol alpha-1,6-mannosyltransferase